VIKEAVRFINFLLEKDLQTGKALGPNKKV
jgi:hypothetical protein